MKNPKDKSPLQSSKHVAIVITPIIMLTSVQRFLDEKMLSSAPSSTGVHIPFAYLEPARSVLRRTGRYLSSIRIPYQYQAVRNII
jgi:hypothetical protein